MPDATGLEPLYLAGDRHAIQLDQGIVGSQWRQTIEGAPSLTLSVKSDVDKIGRVTRATAATVRGELYTLAGLAKTDVEFFDLELESATSVALKRQKNRRSAAKGKQSRRQFVAALARDAQRGIDVTGEPYKVRSRKELTTGDDNWWDAAQSIAAEVGRRVFVRRNRLWFASDDWLLDRDPFSTVRSADATVDRLTWRVDESFDVAELTIEARSFDLYAGDVLRVRGEGIADGKWIVADIEGALDTPTVTVRCIQPSPTLPEPTETSFEEGEAGGDAGLALGLAGADLPSGTTDRVRTFLQSLSKARGKPYIWGGVSLTRGADCSGLIVAALRDIGVNAPRFTSHTIHSYGRRISVAQGIRTPGAVLHKAGHVAVSIGGGRTFEASSRSRPIGNLNAEGRGFTSAVLLRWLF